ncbi:MAG: hypothetical protein M1840_002743 [Geoglossum simile]|nr:MAG: hypothetical protein M1840_002743 [Geoglossum simile]
MFGPPWPTSSASLSKTPPSAPITSLPSPPDSSEKERKALARLPPSVVQALDIVHACYQGHPLDDQWIKIHFQVGEYKILQQQLRQKDLWGYVEDKIRFWLRSLAKRTDVDPCVCALASAIGCRASTRILYRTDDDGKAYGEHSPDSSFGHAKAKYPSMVIETSFTQNRKDLPKLAEDYILGSQGNISVVIGLDIVYRGTKEATVSIWKPEQGLDEDGIPFLGVKTIVDAEPFRNSDGSPVSDGNLTLSLSDILPACMTTSITCPLPTFTIPYLKLARFLQFGEASQQVTESESGSYAMELPIGTKIRRRAASPEETLSPRRERAFAKSEKQAEEQTMRDDGTYGQ